MHDPSRVRVSGPLEVFASRFAAELARLGYRRTPATFQLQLMAHASRWLAGERLGELTSEVWSGPGRSDTSELAGLAVVVDVGERDLLELGG